MKLSYATMSIYHTNATKLPVSQARNYEVKENPMSLWIITLTTITVPHTTTFHKLFNMLFYNSHNEIYILKFSAFNFSWMNI